MSTDSTQKKKGIGAAWIFIIGIVVLTILTFVIAPLWISLGLFIAIYLPAILYILIYKWIDRWFAAAIFSFSIWLNIIILLIPVAGGLLFLDLNNFSEDFTTQTKYIAIEDNGIIFAARINSLELSEESFAVLNSEEISQLQNEINNNLVEEKIVFLIDKEVFRIVDTIEQPEMGITLTKDEAFELIKSENPLEFLSNSLSIGLGNEQNMEMLASELSNSNINADTIKIFAVAMLLQQTLTEGGAEYLVNELKNGNIEIYPKRLSLTLLIKIVPADMITGLLPSSPISGNLGLSKSSDFQDKAKPNLRGA